MSIAAIVWPGGTYFFTVNLLEHCTDLLVCHIESLRAAVAHTRAERPFHIDGWLALPDHVPRSRRIVERGTGKPGTAHARAGRTAAHCPFS
jgi:hypothetical protein